MAWLKSDIAEKLATNDQWLIRGIIAIYKLQTEEEQSCEETLENNGVGFNGVDGPFLSSLAEQINKGRSLSVKQIAAARKSMKKYAGQLTKIANGVI